jgi:alpha-mannosidase
MAEVNTTRKAVAHGDMWRQYWCERAEAQFDFADGLCERRAGGAREWRRMLASARALVERAARSGVAMEQPVREAERILAPFSPDAKRHVCYAVAHAHIDMNWMWGWPETVAVVNDTFTTMLRLMEEFPQFCFSQSQASVYAIAEEHNPALFEQIVRRVREGRWEVTASHWVEGDKNMVGGEGLCRHLLYTRRYMEERFGLGPEDVPVDWSPDTFGFAETVPTYLVRGGVKYLYLHRPGAVGPKRPGAFWWRGPDGACVLVRNDMRLAYNGVMSPSIARHLLTFRDETGVPFFMFVYGVGDHGGGPTRRDLRRALDMDTWPVFPHVRFSTVRSFFERLETEAKRLPTLEGELNYEFTGCYTTQTLIKRANRLAERALIRAESAAATHWAATGSRYPAARLADGWRHTLFAHFHDILPGSGVADTRTYTHAMFQQTTAATGVVETEALRGLAARVDTSAAAATDDLPSGNEPRTMGAGAGMGSSEGGLSQAVHHSAFGRFPVVVFNPAPWTREEVVETVLWDPGTWGWKERKLDDIPVAFRRTDGRPVRVQVIEKGEYWGHDFLRVLFPARVAAGGYATYVIEEVHEPPIAEGGARQTGQGFHCGYSRYERSSEGLANEFLVLDLDTQTGGIRSLVDCRNGKALVREENPRPIIESGVERAFSMTAWSVGHEGMVERPRLVRMTRGHVGPYQASIEAVYAVRSSEFTVTYSLRSGDPMLYVQVAGTWFERGTKETGVPFLRFVVPTVLRRPRAFYEIPFGGIERDLRNGEEVPALRWAMLRGTKREPACLVVNDCKHGHSVVGGSMRVTLIRTSYDPDPLPEVGFHTMRFGILPLTKPMTMAEACRVAEAFADGLRAVHTDAHAGDWPTERSLVSLNGPTVVLDAIKKAEEGDSLVVRMHETDGRPCKAELTFDRQVFGRVTGVEELDLIERPLKKGAVKMSGNRLVVAVPPRGIVSLRVRFVRKT